jgi:hypothetical protein
MIDGMNVLHRGGAFDRLKQCAFDDLFAVLHQEQGFLKAK